jgi:RNA polymerase sigma-70 factor (ECF subfamily)
MTDRQLVRSADDADDDGSLVRRVADGDRLAFECLMRRYNRRLYRLARAVLRDRTEAEDALQEAYLCAFRSIKGYRAEAALSTWLSRLVLNECLGRKRRSSRRQGVIPMIHHDQSDAMDNSAAPEKEQPDELIASVQMRILLEAKLEQLPESFRVVFVLRSVEELSVEETAACLGIPAETVRSRHFRAKGLLREALAHEIDLAERELFDFGGEHCDRVVASVMQRLQPM